MSLFVVDVEADGNIIGEHSMVCFGAVLVKDMTKTFYGQTRPIGGDYKTEALAISGFTRMEHEKFDNPADIMVDFSNWVLSVNEKGTRPTMVSDNIAFDFSWINWYLLKYTGDNPFGWSGRRIGDMYAGLVKNAREPWKHLRKTNHDHNPVNDAMGNAEVLWHLRDNMGLKMKF